MSLYASHSACAPAHVRVIIIYVHQRGAFSVARFDLSGNARASTRGLGNRLAPRFLFVSWRNKKQLKSAKELVEGETTMTYNEEPYWCDFAAEDEEWESKSDEEREEIAYKRKCQEELQCDEERIEYERDYNYMRKLLIASGRWDYDD